MPAAALFASAADFTSFTPPALPRPPACTCALTTETLAPSAESSSNAFAAPSASCASRPRSTGTPCLASSSFAWYSWIFTGPPREDARGPRREPPDPCAAGITRCGAPASAQQPLLLQQREVLADGVGRIRERLHVGVGELELDDLLDALLPQHARHAEVDVLLSVLAREPGGARQQAALVAQDRARHLDHRRRGRVV